MDITRAVRARWGADAPLIAVDTSGAALRAVVDEASPDLIKPNDEELAELVGVALESGSDLAAAVLAASLARSFPARWPQRSSRSVPPAPCS